MPRPFTVRPYLPGDDRRILDLFNNVFGEDNPDFIERTLDEWRWEFLENPGGTTIFVGVTSDGRIISQYACLPVIANLRGERVRAIQGIDSVVDRDYRRGLRKEGAFLATASAFFDHWGVPERNAFGWGFPNKRVYRVGVKLLGYQPIEEPANVLFRNLSQHPDDECVARGVQSDLPVRELQRFGSAADRLFMSLGSEFPIAVWRDARYLNWRYADCPVARYRIFAVAKQDSAVPDGELRALAVVRPDWQGLPILAVTEWMVAESDLEAAGVLLRHILREARRMGQQRLEMWQSPRSRHFNSLQSLGLEVEPGFYNLCVMPYRPGLTAEDFERDFRYSLGDVDVF